MWPDPSPGDPCVIEVATVPPLYVTVTVGRRAGHMSDRAAALRLVGGFTAERRRLAQRNESMTGQQASHIRRAALVPPRRRVGSARGAMPGLFDPPRVAS